MRSPATLALPLIALLALPAAACEDQGTIVGDDGAFTGVYDDPEDFDRAGCDDGVTPMDEVDLIGIYHVEVDVPGYSTFPVPARFDAAAGGLTGRLQSHDGTVEVSATDVFLRAIYETASGPRMRVLDLCAARADGSVHGAYASCTPEGCLVGAVDGRKVLPLDEPEAEGLTLLGSFNGTAAEPWLGDGLTVNVRVADGVAYVARYQDGLRTVDVSDPSAPAALGHLPVEYPDSGEIYNDVKLLATDDGSRYAYMCSSVGGAVVVDVTDPTAPRRVTSFGTQVPDEGGINVHTIFLDGGRAYLANTDLGLEIWDLADPESPERLGTFVHPDLATFGGFLHDLYVAGDRAYLNYWNLGMAIVDVSDPTAPELVGNFVGYGEETSHSSWVTQIGARDVAVHGDEQYGSHVHIVDVTEGSVAFLDVLAEYQTRPEVSAHNVLAAGDLAYVTYYQDGLRVLDLADPANPVKLAHFHTWPGSGPDYGNSFYEGAIGIDLDKTSGTIYVADTHRGLFVLALDP
jgi:hypothetical protein